MNCPNCKTKMTKEEVGLTVSVPLDQYFNPLSRHYRKDVKTLPSAHYRCENCDSEWVWIRGVSGIRQIDGANYDQTMEHTKESQ